MKTTMPKVRFQKARTVSERAWLSTCMIDTLHSVDYCNECHRESIASKPHQGARQDKDCDSYQTRIRPMCDLLSCFPKIEVVEFDVELRGWNTCWPRWHGIAVTRTSLRLLMALSVASLSLFRQLSFYVRVNEDVPNKMIDVVIAVPRATACLACRKVVAVVQGEQARLSEAGSKIVQSRAGATVLAQGGAN